MGNSVWPTRFYDRAHSQFQRTEQKLRKCIERGYREGDLP